ncbi:MAG: ATP-binding protein [Nitrospirae bacterium YQR-1]
MIILFVSRVWFQGFFYQETSKLLRWQMKNSRNNVEYFLNMKLSALKFIVSEYSISQLKEEKTLHKCLTNIRKEFGDIVDIGVIDAGGTMISYVGPYKIKGNTFTDHDWFQQVIVRDTYISDVFLGYRKLPHFAIAIKIVEPESQDYLVIRATIDTYSLLKLIRNVSLREGDDVFLINKNGLLQTPSKLFGDVLNTYKGLVPELSGDTAQTFEGGKNGQVIGFINIRGSTWLLVNIIHPKMDTLIVKFFFKELLSVYIAGLVVLVTVTVIITNLLVNRIKVAHQERETAMMEIEHSSKMASVGRLAAGVAHEINNPLAIINQNSGLLVDIIEITEEMPNCGISKELANKFRNIAGTISNAVSRCHTITHRLLGFARRMDVNYEEVDIKELIREVIGFLEKEMQYKNIQLTEDYSSDLPRVITDKGQLQQVILNIINNAFDAVEKGGIIEVSSHINDDSRLIIAIKDNGSGMSEEQQKHIFEPFFSTKERGKGTGLGLSISNGIVKKLGGSLLVQSSPGKGSVFNIDLPLKRNDMTLSNY